MIQLKRWAVLALAAILTAGLLSGCGQQEKQLKLSVCAGGDVATFDPAYVTDASDATVVGSLYENLMRLSTDVSGNTTVTEGIAQKVDVKENYDGTVTYTFRLRSTRWSDGKALTAQDFVYAWQRLVNPATNSPNAGLLSMVKGYDEVRAGGDVSQLSVTAKNDSTLVVVLSGKYDWFLSDVCTAVATSPLRQDVIKQLKEKASSGSSSDLKWWHDPTLLVTDGPYCVSSYVSGNSLTLTANQRYYGNVGPTQLQFLFADSSEAAWELYTKGSVDFVASLPEEQLKELYAAGQWSATPELSTYTILFNCAQLPFNDASVRKAFSLAVDRTALAALAGVTGQAAGGLVPYGVPGDSDQDFRTAGGDLLNTAPEDYALNCETALESLSKTGYDDRYHLVYLYVDEGPAAQVAQALVQQWRNVLHVSVTPKAVTQAVLSTALASGDFFMAGVSQTAMANDAEAFLSPYTSRNSQNVTQYANSAYDTLLTIIDSASDVSARLACLHDAESLLLSDAAVSPLFFTGTAWKLRETYTGVSRDARGWFRLADITAAG